MTTSTIQTDDVADAEQPEERAGSAAQRLDEVLGSPAALAMARASGADIRMSRNLTRT